MFDFQENKINMIPIILSGGAGSRLWPVSRELHPKPFIRLDDGQSLLQKAFLRGARLPFIKEVLTVTNRELLFKTKEEFRAVNTAGVATSFILEPFGRNTAAAIAAAALHVIKIHGEHSILLVLAADHLITDQTAFQEAVMQAASLAQEGNLVTFGIQANSPETAYGYIEAEENTVVRFVEKPTPSKAQEYIDSGRYLWNSGMFCFTAGLLLQQMDKYCPDILASMRICIEKSRLLTDEGLAEIELDPITFKNVADNSIDYALMEKSSQIAVVPCSIGWSDIGSWRAIGDLIQPDDNGNRTGGEVLLHDVHHCHIQSDGRLVGVVGVDNLIVIDTPDALLIADRDRSQDVKHLYTQLKGQDHDVHKLHRTVFRPWGTYTVLEEGRGFKIKRIEVNPGASLSLQMHLHRSEHWVVVIGTATVTNGETVININANESTFIPAGNKHRLENLTDAPIVLIEVQSGHYLGEDDIIRFQDIYGRARDESLDVAESF